MEFGVASQEDSLGQAQIRRTDGTSTLQSETARRGTQKGRKKGKNREGVQKSCSPLSCLNNMVFALKTEKNTVNNFLAQERRLNAKINFMSKFSSFNHLID